MPSAQSVGSLPVLQELRVLARDLEMCESVGAGLDSLGMLTTAQGLWPVDNCSQQLLSTTALHNCS